MQFVRTKGMMGKYDSVYWFKTRVKAQTYIQNAPSVSYDSGMFQTKSWKELASLSHYNLCLAEHSSKVMVFPLKPQRGKTGWYPTI
jgi:hypothetical protein